jgi:hypothetical protein
VNRGIKALNQELSERDRLFVGAVVRDVRHFARANVRGHRADEIKETIRDVAPEAPGGPRC